MTRPITADRVKETTQTTGPGTLALAGAADGFTSFVIGIGTAKPCYYLIADDPTSTTDWEVGVGTVTSGTPNTLSRDRVIASSNSGSKVSWNAGTKTVIVTETSELLNILVDTLDSDLVTGGTSTAYTVSTNNPALGFYEGRFIVAKLHTTSGTAPALNADSGGLKAIKLPSGDAPAPGAMVGGGYYFFKADAANDVWQMFSPVSVFGTSQIADGAVTLAKMADGTENGFITYDSGGNAVEGALGDTLEITTGVLDVVAATTDQDGVVELATVAEVRTGTDAARAVTPEGFAGASIGHGQTWQNVTGSRAKDVVYQNTTGRPIMVAIKQVNNVRTLYVSADNVTFIEVGWTGVTTQGVTAIVPPNHYYKFNENPGYWAELR